MGSGDALKKLKDRGVGGFMPSPPKPTNDTSMLDRAETIPTTQELEEASKPKKRSAEELPVKKKAEERVQKNFSFTKTFASDLAKTARTYGMSQTKLMEVALEVFKETYSPPKKS